MSVLVRQYKRYSNIWYLLKKFKIILIYENSFKNVIIIIYWKIIIFTLLFLQTKNKNKNSVKQDHTHIYNIGILP